MRWFHYLSEYSTVFGVQISRGSFMSEIMRCSRLYMLDKVRFLSFSLCLHMRRDERLNDKEDGKPSSEFECVCVYAWKRKIDEQSESAAQALLSSPRMTRVSVRIKYEEKISFTGDSFSAYRKSCDYVLLSRITDHHSCFDEGLVWLCAYIMER